jgi:hypothetical protein
MKITGYLNNTSILVGEASVIAANMPEKAKEKLLKAVKITPEAPVPFSIGRIYTPQKD